jgi:hypothetical protein
MGGAGAPQSRAHPARELDIEEPDAKLVVDKREPL